MRNQTLTQVFWVVCKTLVQKLDLDITEEQVGWNIGEITVFQEEKEEEARCIRALANHPIWSAASISPLIYGGNTRIPVNYGDPFWRVSSLPTNNRE